MSRYEIFNRSKSFFGGAYSRKFNGVAGRILNETVHTGHLSNSPKRTSGSGLPHIVNRTVRIKAFRYELLNLIFGAMPNFNIFSQFFIFIEQSFFVLLHDFFVFFLRRTNHGSFSLRNFNIVNSPADSGKRRVFEAEGLNPVHNIRNFFYAINVYHIVNDSRHNFLGYLFVFIMIIIRQNAVEKKPAYSSFKNLAAEFFISKTVSRHNFYFGSKADRSEIISCDSLVR